MLNILKKIIDAQVEKLLLIIFPPVGEQYFSQIDMSVGLVLSSFREKMIVISTDNDELTSPSIKFEDFPKSYYKWKDFQTRMYNWFENKNDTDDIVKEYYDLSEGKLFTNIVSNRIEAIDLLKCKEFDTPIGVRILFKKDYILSMPIIDGNTIETSIFNKNNNLSNFEHLGELYFEGIDKQYI
ncbi:MAG: hypothetical protein AAFP82_17180 [Bacteroidota bacterium]